MLTNNTKNEGLYRSTNSIYDSVTCSEKIHIISVGYVFQASAGEEKREQLYKVLVIGELGTGKTSIIKRYVHQFFSQHYRATVSFTSPLSH